MLLSITTSMRLVNMYAQFMNVIKFFSANLTYRVVRMLISVCFHDITLTKQNKKVTRLDSSLIERCGLERVEERWIYYITFYNILYILILPSTWLFVHIGAKVRFQRKSLKLILSKSLLLSFHITWNRYQHIFKRTHIHILQ